MQMIFNCMPAAAKMTPASRPKLIVKSLIFLVLLALAGIGIAAGAERSGVHPAMVRTATAVAPGPIAGGRTRRNPPVAGPVGRNLALPLFAQQTAGGSGPRATRDGLAGSRPCDEGSSTFLLDP